MFYVFGSYFRTLAVILVSDFSWLIENRTRKRLKRTLSIRTEDKNLEFSCFVLINSVLLNILRARILF